MKSIFKTCITMLCSALLVVPVLAGCGEEEGGGETEFIDYVANLKLDMSSDTKKQEVTVRNYIDGDTTHFDPKTNSTITSYNAADFAETYGYIKARYLAVNTPESTGDVEKWGKTASNFTHEKLESAKSIIVESDNNKWNIDSTGERYTLWIWYMPQDGTDYRNLNIELLQYGYGRAQSSKDNRYGDIAMDAIVQAQNSRLRVYSNDVDENFYEGEAFNMTLKKLRCHLQDYVQKTVRVEGVVTTQMGESVYIEDYDEETGLYFGISVYYGYTPGADLRSVLKIGNRVSVHGTVTYFETGDSYQISGVTCNSFHPEFTTNTVIVEGGEGTGEASFAEHTAKEITSGTKEIRFISGEEEEEEVLNFKIGEALLDTTVSLKNLVVESVSTTSNGGENDGAMSLHCVAGDGTKITVRTTVFKEDGVLVKKDKYEGKTINVKGIVEKYYGNYQVKVHLMDFIEIVG